ncbi:anthranilate phosphoribosyltransferase, TrpD [Fistulina hepatica ATCC 64428]|nr:anthranilate phosphoribosyltransferase, TrpD [Fistulina hepatica ATCC 64428]
MSGLSSQYTSESFKPLLNKLVQTPEYFSAEDLKRSLEHLFTQKALTPVQIGAFLTALHLHRVERRPENLAAAASVLRRLALKADVKEREGDFVVDIVGTGGDGYNLFNVSTTAGIVAAGAGARVIKHGSRASTSSSGSADLLQSLHCLFPVPSPDINNPIPRIPFTFILAPHYHPSLAYIAPYRKQLPFRTMFNILGPLLNPAKPSGMVLGIADENIGDTYARSLREGGVERVMIVCGYEALDEISCAGPTHVWSFAPGNDGIKYETITPDMFGVETHPLDHVKGGSPDENARTFEHLLHRSGGAPVEPDLKPVLDFVLINASALLVVAGIAKDYKEGTRLALESVVSGKAWEALQIFREQGEKAVLQS